MVDMNLAGDPSMNVLVYYIRGNWNPASDRDFKEKVNKVQALITSPQRKEAFETRIDDEEAAIKKKLGTHYYNLEKEEALRRLKRIRQDCFPQENDNSLLLTAQRHGGPNGR